MKMTDFATVFQPIPLRLNYRLISTIRYLQRFYSQKNNSCTPWVPMFLFWQEIHSFISINIETKHPRALICVYNRIGHILVIAKDSRTIARKTGSPFVQFISREISQATSSLTFSTRNSILETRSSRLETQNYRGSSLEARGTVNLLLLKICKFISEPNYSNVHEKNLSQVSTCE